MSKQTKVEEVYEDEYDEVEVETELVKKRSFFVALAFLAAIASVAVFVYGFLDTLLPVFQAFGDNLTSLELLLPAGVAVAALIGVILSIVALIKASKPTAVFAWLFYVASAVALFAYMELVAGGIVEAFTAFTGDMAGKFMPVVAMICAVASVILSFIGMIGTGTKEVEVEYEYVEVDDDEEETAQAPKGGQTVVNPPAYVRPVVGQPYPQTVVQPVPQPVPQPMPYPQPIVQPMPYYQPMPYQAAPNVYINIAPNGAVTSGAPAEAQPMSAPVEVKPVAPATSAPQPVEKNTYVAAAAPQPVVSKFVEDDEYYEEEVEEEVVEKPKKTRSPFTVLAILACLASVGLFVFAFLNDITALFSDVMGNITNLALLLPVGAAVAALVGVIFAIASIAKASKGAAVGAWLFMTASAVAVFAYIELVAGGIVEAFTGMAILPIVAMVCGVIAVLFSFIGIIQNGNVKKEKEEVADEEVAQEKPKKTRSFFTVLAILACLASVGLYLLAISFISSFTGIDSLVSNITNPDKLLLLGIVLAGLVGVIFAIASIAKASKGAAVGAWLFMTASAVAVFAYMQLFNGGILPAITNFELFPVIAMVCGVLAVLFSFIAMIQTGNVKKVAEEVDEMEELEAEAVAEPVASEPAQEEAAVASESVAPVASEPAPQPAPAPVAPAAAPAPTADDDEEEEEETDAFLRTLSPAQKREFNKVFLQGKAPAFLPAYKVDGNNNRFFDSVFVFLGKSREIMSDELLGKIYDYMMENK